MNSVGGRAELARDYLTNSNGTRHFHAEFGGKWKVPPPKFTEFSNLVLSEPHTSQVTWAIWVCRLRGIFVWFVLILFIYAHTGSPLKLEELALSELRRNSTAQEVSGPRALGCGRN